jgi:hypothetical protein
MFILTSEFLHLREQEPFNRNPKGTLHKNCNAVIDACKNNLKSQYKVFNETAEKKNESRLHIPHF